MRPVALTTALACFGGCFPATMTTVPALRGRVIDRAGLPVAGAKVVVSEKSEAAPTEPFLTLKADATGRIDAKAQVRWFLFIVPEDMFPRTLLVRAESDQGRSLTREVTVNPSMAPFGLGGAGQRTDLGDLRLQPD